MNIAPIAPVGQRFDSAALALRHNKPAGSAGANELTTRQAFDSFVGQTFYGQMLKALRNTVQESKLFHGGQGEKVFRAQLDQVLAERMAESSAATFTGPMYERFMAG